MEIFGFIKFLEDPRREHGRKYRLADIMYIALCAAIASCDDWYEVEEFAKHHEELFKRKLPGLEGIPSHDTFNRVFSLIKPEKFEEAFRLWTKDIAQRYKGVVAIDGKTIRGASETASDGSISKMHIVTAWAVENGLCLGQQRVTEKSNEITADPELIKALDLKDVLITIDAMGCQKKIAKTITECGGDFIFGLKKNQKQMYNTVEWWWSDIDKKHVPPTRLASYTTDGNQHGRHEVRKYEMYSWGSDTISMFPEWEIIRSVVRVQSQRTENATGKTSTETRYYVSSLKLDVEKAAYAIRAHWSIENNLHWQLDVTFNEDATRKKKNTAQNWSLISKIALPALKKHPSKGSMKLKRRKASWDPDFMEEIIELVYQDL